MRWLVLCLFAPALAAQTPRGSIHGIVKDAVSGAPLSEFSVHATAEFKNADAVTGTEMTLTLGGGPSGPITATVHDARREKTDAVTGADGTFSITNLPPGPITVTTHNARREDVTQKIQLNAGDDLPLTILVPPNATIAGRVVNEDNEPVANLPVWIVRTETSYGAPRHSLMGPQVTGKDGRYRFDFGLSAGRKYFVLAEVQAPSKLNEKTPIEVPTYYGDTQSLNMALPIALRRGEARDGVDIKIRKVPHYCVGGDTKYLGKGEKQSFQIFEDGFTTTRLARAQGASGDDGSFQVCRLPSGQYQFISKSHGVTSSTRFEVSGGPLHNLHVSVENAADVKLEMVWDGPPAPQPSADFRDQLGNPAKVTETLANLARSIGMGVTVQLTAIDFDARWSARGAPPYSGSFGVPISPGDYTVDFGMPPACCYVKELTYNESPVTGRRIHIGGGSSGTLHVALSTEFGTIACQAADADGKPLQGVSVLVFGAGGERETPSGITGADGIAKVAPLAPGKYRVIALNRAVRLPEDEEKIRTMWSTATEVEVSAKSTATVKLTAVAID